MAVNAVNAADGASAAYAAHCTASVSCAPDGAEWASAAALGAALGAGLDAALDAISDAEMWSSYACALASFVLVCVACFVAEKLPIRRAQPWRPNGGRLTNAEWLAAARVAAANALVAHLPVNALAFWHYRHVSGHGTSLDVTTVAAELCFCAAFVEVWFYATHRALHTPWLYARVHKVHHRFAYPSAVCGLYAHWLEFALANQLGVVGGPVLVGCHPLTTRVWLSLALANVALSHAGFGFGDHDAHHETFQSNYGVFGACDKLFGTVRRVESP
jgi:sterol desaturase/sphingolipid hydroxylase (fatty acid hydroxylase superfamily)